VNIAPGLTSNGLRIAMRIQLLGLGSVALLGLAGCSSSANPVTGISGNPGTYEDISGQYSAPVTATGDGLLLTGTMLLSIAQTKSTFTGTYSVVGKVDDGNTIEDVVLQGTIVNGKVTTGSDPSLQLDLSPTTCGPTFTANAGTYGSALQRITLMPAHIPVPPNACAGSLRVVNDTLTFLH
jgi:hypothetical protein